VGNLKKVAMILLALSLIIAFPLPVYADDIINITVTDANNDGINFGDVEPGYEVGDVAQDDTGAVTITVHEDTNVDCNIQIRGSDNFTDGSGHTLLLSNAKWSITDNISESTTMTSSYVTMDTSIADTEKIVYVWHWLSVPSDQYASTYNTTFYYQAIKR
jgi:hypothetical protein